MRILANCMPIPDIPLLFLKALPEQGSVELQHDAPGKRHDWHIHTTDETLIILTGALNFQWEGGEQVCRPGDVIELPAGFRHRSVATEQGAIYLIAFWRLDV